MQRDPKTVSCGIPDFTFDFSLYFTIFKFQEQTLMRIVSNAFKKSSIRESVRFLYVVN